MELALDHLLVQLRHVWGGEWRFQGGHLVEYAASAPDVALGVVRQVLPHLWACVVRRTCLGLEHGAFGYFGNVEISEFDLVRFAILAVHHEQVGTLDIPMHNVVVVECLQPLHELNEVLPQLLLWKIASALLEPLDLLQDVPARAELHHEAEGHRCVVDEGLFVLDDVLMLYGREDAYFIEGVLLLFL